MHSGRVPASCEETSFIFQMKCCSSSHAVKETENQTFDENTYTSLTVEGDVNFWFISLAVQSRTVIRYDVQTTLQVSEFPH